MVEIPFSVKKGVIDWSDMFDDPAVCAEHLWNLNEDTGDPTLEEILEEEGLASACDIATFDRHIYDQLYSWAKEQEGLSDRSKVLLFDLFLKHKKPDPRKAEPAYRANKMVSVTRDLVRLPMSWRGGSTRLGQTSLSLRERVGERGLRRLSPLRLAPGFPPHPPLRGTYSPREKDVRRHPGGGRGPDRKGG
ncbi:hypothetical protein LP7551_00896 [Roseibium album]|nr:hypothetical protein LP7551_00896 [Roseibium album]